MKKSTIFATVATFALACLALVSTQPSSRSASAFTLAPGETTLTFFVPGTQPWTSTNLVLAAGQSVGFVAAGQVAVNNYASELPDGDPTCVPDTSFTAPGLTCYSLIGRIGASPPFEIGAARNLTVATSGILYLGVNDQVNAFGDNSGQWTVDLTIPPAMPPPALLNVNLPGPNAILTGPTLPFAWTAYRGARFYYLQFWLVDALSRAPLSDRASTNIALRLRGTHYRLSAAALPRGLYHWRMAAANAQGSLISPWTPERDVTIPSL